jgi:hypothetical protein
MVTAGALTSSYGFLMVVLMIDERPPSPTRNR